MKFKILTLHGAKAVLFDNIGRHQRWKIEDQSFRKLRNFLSEVGVSEGSICLLINNFCTLVLIKINKLCNHTAGMLLYIANISKTLTFGHINDIVPDPVRSRKISSFEPSQ